MDQFVLYANALMRMKRLQWPYAARTSHTEAKALSTHVLSGQIRVVGAHYNDTFNLRIFFYFINAI